MLFLPEEFLSTICSGSNLPILHKQDYQVSVAQYAVYMYGLVAILLRTVITSLPLIVTT